MHIMYCIALVSIGACPLWLSQWQSVHCESRLHCYWLTRRTELFRAYHFRCKFFGCFQFSWLIFRYVIVVFTNRWNCHGRQDTITLYSKAYIAFSAGILSKPLTHRARLQSTCVHWTCLVHTPHNMGIFRKTEKWDTVTWHVSTASGNTTIRHDAPRWLKTSHNSKSRHPSVTTQTARMNPG